MSKAMDIANYIVHYSNEQGAPISNLKLQKLLYFVWIEYYNKTKKYLFKDYFYAWHYGPVIPEVYYEYCAYGGFLIIDDVLEPDLRKEEKDVINEVVTKYKDKSAGSLVNETHKIGHAWEKTYDKYCKKIISFDDIIALECGR